MSNDNGSPGAPFGPHGEDCDCNWDEPEEPSPEEQPEADATITVGEDRSDKYELMFNVISDAMAREFLAANEALFMEGNGLNRGQNIRMLSVLMRTFASAKEIAVVVDREYDRVMADTEAAEVEATPPPLADIKETFSRGSD